MLASIARVNTAAFIEQLSDSLAASAAGASGLAARLEALVSAARAAWPQIECDADRFLGFVAARLPDGDDWSRALEAAHTDALYLTCACAAGDAAAIERFEARYAAEIDIALASVALDSARAAEVRQQIREKLFVGEAPKIASYTGRGDLRSWVRAVAVRAAISLLRRQKREVPVADPVLGALADPADDPEIAHLKDLYRGEFSRAFRDAFAALSARDRTLLRYKFADGLSIDEIATIYDVHRATAARWLARIRERLLVETRKRLKASLQVGSSELESIVRLIQSQLDVTLSGLWPADEAE